MKQAETTQRFVGYVRTSTLSQDSSLSTQESEIRRFVSERDGVLVEMLVDRGVSGTVPAHLRPGAARALEVVAGGDADAIVVMYLDRWTRAGIGDMCGLVGKTVVVIHDQHEDANHLGEVALLVADWMRSEGLSLEGAALHELVLRRMPGAVWKKLRREEEAAEIRAAREVAR